MRKRTLTSRVAALSFFAIVGLVAALMPSISWPNLARAHTGDASLTALTVTAGGTAQTLSPAFSSTVYSYTVHVDNSVSQVTISGTAAEDGTVTYQYADAASGTDGHQVSLATLGGKSIDVVASHTDIGTTTQTYTVLVIRNGTVATDRAALMALYNSAGGASWTDKTNWGSTEPLGTWYGVFTDSSGRVEGLDLADNKLSGTLPAALGNLDQLGSLYMWSNQLRGTIPDLSNLTLLGALYLSDNDLSGSIPVSLGSLPQMQLLSLWGNQLTGEIPEELGNLTLLSVLYLGGNALSGQIPASLGSLASLDELSMGGNQLSGEIPASLGNLTSLTYLDISRNNLDGPIPDLGRFTILKYMYLWGNQLSGEIPATLNNLGSLRELYLNRNELSGTIPNLGSLTNLTHLYLNHNQLSGSIPSSLSSLTRLEELNLSSNLLDGSIPAWLNSLTRLTSLWADHNALSGTIPTLSSLSNLEKLHLHNNDLTGGIPNWLGNLTTLTSLSLNSNELDGPIPNLSGLFNLTELSLRNNELTGPIPAWLGQLTGLTRLYLSVNQLSGDFPTILGNLTNLEVTRFASNPSLTGCVPIGLRYLLNAEDFESTDFDPDRRTLNLPAQDFIPDDTNGDGDTDDREDTPGLNLPFCMVSALTFSDVTLAPAFGSGTVAYTASVANAVESTTVTATLADSNDPLSIRKGSASYTSGAAVPLAVGPNEITITVTPTDGTPTLTYTVTIFREGMDRATLMALYNSAGGASWTSKSNWGETGVDIGTWEGVTTDANGRVTALELPGNNLSGTLPAALGTLTSLTTLDLSDNRLSETIPDLSALNQLQDLYLGDNQLSGTIPDWLGSLTGLQDLSLRDNRLTGPIPEDWDALNQLDVLYLDDNQLNGTIPAALGSLSGLQAARFAGNTLTGCVPNGLRYLVTASDIDGLPAHDFIAVDANDDGDTTDDGDTPGLGLPFCPLRSLTFSGVTLEPVFASDTVVYTAAADHAVTSTTVTATFNESGDTVSIMEGANTYTNSASVPLDVGENEITVTVTTTDGTPTPHIYTVTVTRAPNASPAFHDGPTTTRGVDENTATGMDIGDPVAATDGDNDTLTYSLDATSQATFDIVPTTGQLQTKSPLDYETKGTYTVTVSVRDSKNDDGDTDEVTDDTITVTILVADLNEAPEFPVSETGQRSVDENTAAGVNIGAPVAATDDDNDALTYSLDTTSQATFDIVPATGQLQTKSALDYDIGTRSYQVDVTAADPSGAKDIITVTITVNNVDESGTVTLSSTQLIVGTPLTATLTDLDGVSGSVTWSWARSPNGTTDWALLGGETSDTYTPVAADVDHYLRATASYDDEEGPDKSAQAFPANKVLPAPIAPNEPPAFDEGPVTWRVVDENTPAGVDIGEPVTATDPENDTLTYSLDVTSRATFDIVATTGQLQTKADLDHETTLSYVVTVIATDTAGATDTIDVTITAIDVDEPGTVTLSSLQPLVAIPLTASLDDGDGVRGVTWSWWRSPNGTTDWALMDGETSDTYTPVADDMGDYLRATASYDDEHGAYKSAQAVSANAVEVAPGRNKPVLREHPTATRSVPRNTPAGRNIGAPLSATDADNDLLTYSLGGPDGAGFDIVASTGQLQTKAVLTGIQRTIYKVFVSVSDGKDDLGNTETNPQIDATTEVTITVTTTSRTSGGGGGGGGGFGPAPVAPKFIDGFRTTHTVAQNARAGDSVGDPVSATHPEDLEITYSLSGADATSFTVDAETGQLRLGEGATLELGQTYTVNLTATDSAGFGAIIIVMIEVTEASFSPYDRNGNDRIDREEVLMAVSDYFKGSIDKDEVIEVIKLYFAG